MDFDGFLLHELWDTKGCFCAFHEMGLNRVRPNSITPFSILPACSELKDLSSGKEIHGFVVRNGLGDNVFVSSALVNMYASCSTIKQAQLVFEKLSQRTLYPGMQS